MGESWVQCVTRVYHENKKKNSGYKFKQAMKDAKSVYNKSKSVVSEFGDNKEDKQTTRKGRRGTGRRNRGTRRR